MKNFSYRRKRYLLTLTNTIVLLIISATMVVFTMLARELELSNILEKISFHTLFQLRLTPRVVDTRIVVIQTTHDDIKNFGHAGNIDFPDLPLRVYSQLIQTVTRAQPLLTSFDFIAAAHNESYADVSAFAQRFKDHKRLLMSIPFSADNSIIQSFSVLPEVHYMSYMTETVGDPMFSYNYYGTSNFKLIFDRALDFILAPNTDPNKADTSNTIDTRTNAEFRKRLSANTLFVKSQVEGVLINYRKNNVFKHYSASEVLDKKFDPHLLRGKIVLIGNGLCFPRNDAIVNCVLTSNNRYEEQPEYDGSPLVTIFANIINTFTTQTEITIRPMFDTWTLTIIACLLVLLAWFLLWPPLVVVLFVSVLITVLVGDLILMSYFFVYLPIIPIVYFSSIAFFIGAIIRLIKESHRRWQAEERQQILHDGQEIKGNFVSLVSHNLNTFIARLRSLCELLTTIPDLHSPLLTHACQETILKTQHLEIYFRKIINMMKIDEKTVTLTLQTRDFNKLITTRLKEVAQKARLRGVRLSFDETPLFPMRFDPTLVQEIVDHIIDNAICHSHRNSHIACETDEEDDWVIFRITNDGPSLTTHQSVEIFNKHIKYIQTNEATQSQQYHGLGLYLARQFAERHGGSLKYHALANTRHCFVLRLPLTNSE